MSTVSDQALVRASLASGEPRTATSCGLPDGQAAQVRTRRRTLEIRRTGTTIAGPLLVAALLAACLPSASAQTPPWREQESIGWACGGIGFEERQTLKSFESRGNAVLLFSAGSRGTLVADVRLRIVSVADTTRGLEVNADGPICVLHLPAGQWKIESQHGGTVRERTVTLRAQDSGSPQRLQFAFPGEASDSPRASPEEGSQVGDWGRVGR